MAARFLSHFAKVTDESVGLATIVYDQFENVVNAANFNVFAARETFHQAIDQLFSVRVVLQQMITLAHVRRAHNCQIALLQ